MNNKFGISYRTFSAFWYSLGLYFAIILMIFLKFSFSQDAIKYTNDPDAFMDVFVVDTELGETLAAPKLEQKKIESPVVKEEPKVQEQQKTTNKDVPKAQKKAANVNFDDLFSDVSTEEIPSKTSDATQSNAKSDPKTEGSKSAADIVAALQKDIKAKAPKSGMTGVYNKFMGDVLEIIQSRWVRYKADTNNKAKVQIFIDKSGKFSYSIKEYSLNSEFNSKVREFLEQLKVVEFPKPPSGDTMIINTNLIDQIDTEIL